MMDIWHWRCAVKHIGKGLESNWYKQYETRLDILEYESPQVIIK